MNDEQVRTDFEGIGFACPKCGYENSCGVDWSDEDGGDWKCEGCKAPFTIAVMNLGYSVDVKFDDVTLEGSY